MTKFLLALAGGSMLAAVPAAAQYADVNAGGGAGIQNRIAQLDTRLQAGLQSGAITRAQAQSLRPQLRELRRLERQYSLNGLTQPERQDLQQRLRAARQQLRLADRGQGDTYSNWADDGSYGQQQYGRNQGYYGQNPYGRTQGSYGQNPYGQNQGYYGQGGPYQEVNETCRTQGGIGGVIGRVLGTGNNCLEIGQRATGNLGGVPYEYRGQFRDGNGVVYRSDGRNIYQIDARTSTVLRIYPVGN